MASTSAEQQKEQQQQNVAGDELDLTEIPDDVLAYEVPCVITAGENEVVVPVRLSLLLQSNVFKELFKVNIAAAGDKAITVEMLGKDFKFTVSNDRISIETFKRVVKWLEEHSDKPKLEIKKDANTQEQELFPLNDFQREFFMKGENGDDDDYLVGLSELLIASNYLDIRSLHILGTMAFAEHIKNKSGEWLRKQLDLDGDIPEEVRKEIIRKNVWALY